MVRKLSEKICATVRNETGDRDFQAEMEEHLSLLAEGYRQQGMTPDAAMLAARRRFGNTTLLQQERRSLLTLPAFEAFHSDLIFAARMLRKNPGFSIAVIVTLSLSIGANTAIFSICNAVLFKPLPYQEPGRIVMLWEKLQNGTPMTVAPANFVEWRSGSQSFSEMAALNPNASFIVSDQTEAARLAGASVSSSFFSLLGTRFMLGRNFLPEEDRFGQNQVAILSYRVWQEQFGADRSIAGRSITLNDNSYTVVGVLPADFQFATKATDFQAHSQFDIWVPIALDREKLQRGTHPRRVIARLKPGVELAQAQEELNVTVANLARLHQEDNRDKGIVAIPLKEQLTANVKVALETLLGAVELVLLIACANIATLLLSRAAARQKEMSVRIALGATRKRLAQQLLTESLFLSSIGGIAGLLLALAAIGALSPHLPSDLSRATKISVDMRMLMFTAAISLVTGVLFGLGPIFGVGQMNAGESLKQCERVAGGNSLVCGVGWQWRR